MSIYTPNVNNFIGEINLDISNDPNVLAGFESMGRQINQDILLDLLNAALYNDLLADLDGSEEPQTQIYIDLMDGVTYTDDNQETIKYEGLRRMQNYFVYEQYLDLTHSQNSSNGQEYGNNENATKLTRYQVRKAREKLQNKAVDLYYSACKYIDDNYTSYLTANDYTLWKPARKKYLGKITSLTPRNDNFYYGSTNRIKWPT